MISDPALGSLNGSISHSSDYFDRIPDPVPLVILNKICDIKALGRCCLVSKRFHNLVPLVDKVIVRVDCVISDPPASISDTDGEDGGRTRGMFVNVARLVIVSISKPLQALGQILKSPGCASSSSLSSVLNPSLANSGSEVSHHSPTEVLRKFKEIKKLKIELPSGELGVDDGVLLKWKADFGSTLHRCVILGASSMDKSENSLNLNDTSSVELSGVNESGNILESFYMNGSLKLRVVWTISSLIAASARHFLLQPIINDHETLEALDLVDSNGQGMLTMNKLQLKEVREAPVSASGSSQRTLVPALSMKLWFAPYLEIPGGIVLTGATLVAIRPNDESSSENWENNDGFCGEGGWVSNAFEEPYREAVKMLMRRTTYSLEMNSF